MVGLTFLFLASASSAAEPPPATVAELDRLVELYRSYNLPFPPKDAPLVRGGARGPRDGGTAYTAVYVLERDETGRGGWVFCGTQRIHEHGVDSTLVAPTAEIARRTIPYAFEPAFFEDGALAFAAIEHTRGHDAFALEMLRQAKEKERSYTKEYWLVPQDGATLEARVAFLAVQHWTNEIVQPDSDLKVVAENMRQVFAREPKVANEENENTLRRLELTVHGRYSGGEADEALIDKLRGLTQDGSELDSRDPSEKQAIEPLLAVIDRGFEAVPTLLRHLGDERLTRAVHPGIMNSPTTLCTVGEVCCTLLWDYTNTAGGGWWRSKESRKPLAAWWKRTSKTPERAYCLKCLSAPAGWSPSQALIFMAQKRHPDVLPIAYQAVLNAKRDIDTSPYLEAIWRAGLPKDQVARQVFTAAEKKDLQAVRAALWTLSRTSPPTFDIEMAKTLRRLGSHATGPTRPSMEASFAQLAVVSNSDDVWKALAEATRSADPDLRIAMLDESSYIRWTPARKKRWFSYLLGFVNDDSKPAPEKKDTGTGEPTRHAHTFLKARNVGDTAALLAAQQLGIQPIPTLKAPPATWAELRARVKAAILAALSKR